MAQPVGFVRNARTASPLRVQIQIIEVAKIGKDLWEMTVMATLLDNLNLTADFEVQFYLEENAVESPVVVAKGGQRAHKKFTHLRKKLHTFTVNVVGTDLWETQTIDIKEPPRNPTFKLEVTEPNKTEGADTYEAALTGTVIETNRPEFVDDLQVKFFVEGALVDTVDASDGNAMKKATGLKKGNVTFSAEIVGFPGTRKTISKTIKEEGSKKVPKTLAVNYIGPRGKQKLLIAVAAEDNSLIPNFSGLVIAGDVSALFKTDSTGRAVYELNFNEKSIPVEVQAGITPDLTWQARLLGPKP